MQACKGVEIQSHSATEFLRPEMWLMTVGEHCYKWDHAGGTALVRRGPSLAHSQLQPAQALLHMVTAGVRFTKSLSHSSGSLF